MLNSPSIVEKTPCSHPAACLPLRINGFFRKDHFRFEGHSVRIVIAHAVKKAALPPSARTDSAASTSVVLANMLRKQMASKRFGFANPVDYCDTCKRTKTDIHVRQILKTVDL
jgi:hypothetical protein